MTERANEDGVPGPERDRGPSDGDVIERRCARAVEVDDHPRLVGALRDVLGTRGMSTSFERVLGWIGTVDGMEVHVQIAPLPEGGSVIQLAAPPRALAPPARSTIAVVVAMLLLSAMVARVVRPPLGAVLAIAGASGAVFVGAILAGFARLVRRRRGVLEQASDALVAILSEEVVETRVEIEDGDDARTHEATRARR